MSNMNILGKIVNELPLLSIYSYIADRIRSYSEMSVYFELNPLLAKSFKFAKERHFQCELVLGK